MSILPMANAVAGTIADPDEYNRLIYNITDLNTRISSMETGPPNELIRAVFPTQNTNLVSTVTTTETDVNKLAFTTVPVVTGVRYEFTFDVSAACSGSGDTFDFILRHTTPVSGTEIQRNRFVSPPGSPTSGVPIYLPYYFTAASTGNMSFYLSVVRTTGAGNISVQQTTTIRNYAKMRRLGTPGSVIVDVP